MSVLQRAVFTDCMLQKRCKKRVFAIDVGRGQLDWKLRNDPRVICMEKTNIRYVTPEDLGEEIDFSSIDVSFISLTKVLEPIRNYLAKDGEIVALIKPQFEAGREKVGKKRCRKRKEHTPGSDSENYGLCYVDRFRSVCS